MPRSHVPLICPCTVLCVFALLAVFRLSAQSAVDSSVPAEPKALVLALAAENGAPSADAKPGHLKISFTTYNWNGGIESQGAIEEFWLAPSRYKRIFETTTFNQVEYSTIDGIRRTGSRDEAPLELERIFDEFLRPVPFDAESIQAAQVEMKNANYIKAKLLCVSATRGGTSSEQAINATFCSDERLPILRLTILGSGGRDVTRNDIVKFQSRYFPKAIEEDLTQPVNNNRKLMTAKIESLGSLDSVDESQFIPPASAFAPPKVVTLEEAVTKAQLVRHSAPVYPPIARAAHVTGDVLLSFQIQTDGHVSRIRVLSGPAMLQQAAIDAVKNWTFAPFTQDGESVAVNTTAKLSFHL